MTRKLPIILLTFVMAAGAIWAGNMYWNQKKGDFFRRLYARKSFTLIAGDGKIFDTKDFPKDKRILLIFTPDTIPVSAVKPFRFLLRDLQRSRGGGIYLAVTSRVHEDIVRNFLHAAGFTGKVLLDPSGSLGRYLGAWPSMEPAQDWTFVLVDHELKAKWAVAKKEVPDYKEFGDRF